MNNWGCVYSSVQARKCSPRVCTTQLRKMRITNERRIGADVYRLIHSLTHAPDHRSGGFINITNTTATTAVTMTTAEKYCFRIRFASVVFFSSSRQWCRSFRWQNRIWFTDNGLTQKIASPNDKIRWYLFEATARSITEFQFVTVNFIW